MSLRSLMAGSWTLVILGLCWLPRSMMPADETKPPSFLIPHFDKLVHAGIFAVFAFLWMRVGSGPGRMWKVMLAGLLLAIISELGQELSIVGRDATVMDGVADVIGAGLGLLGDHLLGRLASGERSAENPTQA